MVLKQRPIPMPAEIGFSFQRGREGSLDCMWGVQTHSGPPVFFSPVFARTSEWHTESEMTASAGNRTRVY